MAYRSMKPQDVTFLKGGRIIPWAWAKKRKRFVAILDSGRCSKQFATRRAARDWITAVAALT